MSQIKRFRFDLHPQCVEDLSVENWRKAEREMLDQFDQWRAELKPEILSVNFGRRTGSSIYDSSHFVYMDVLIG